MEKALSIEARKMKGDKAGQYDKEWRQFQRQWARPEIIAAKIKEKK